MGLKGTHCRLDERQRQLHNKLVVKPNLRSMTKPSLADVRAQALYQKVWGKHFAANYA